MADIVYTISLDGQASVVARDLDAVVARVAALLHPGEVPDPAGLAVVDKLKAVGAEGSAFHRVRHEAVLARHESLVVKAHLLDAPPNHDGVLATYDMIHECDPAFTVQSQLIGADETDEALEALADGVEAHVQAALASGRRFSETEDAFLARMRHYEADLGTLRVIPEGHDTRAVLAAIPGAARAKFLEIAFAAYPEEAPGATPR